MSDQMENQQFPEGMEPLGEEGFTFACNPEVPCYTRCCHRLELQLYPYDIIRLKNRLKIGSEEFLENYAAVVQGANPFFPSVMLRMRPEDGYPCPFLDPASGCTVYRDRPSACRTYPLERAVDRRRQQGRNRDFYFLVRHDYCQGHGRGRQWTVPEWLADQQLLPYNAMADRWAEMDTLFAANPWQGEGAAGPRQLLAFMVCYNIDRFRAYVREHDLLRRQRLDKARRRAIEMDDEALLSFGFDWLRQVLSNS
ncbi:YkgJ family cysteine cluster protein [Desulfurivibrio alkaliphilus]|nr:YkgJ family cysteine cluster protein [Desulfurivibrio alkaliphilus]